MGGGEGLLFFKVYKDWVDVFLFFEKENYYFYFKVVFGFGGGGRGEMMEFCV